MQKESIHITGYWQGVQFFKLIDFLALKITLWKTRLSEEIWSTSWTKDLKSLSVSVLAVHSCSLR